MNIAIYLLICWGMTNAICKGKIFEPLRNLFKRVRPSFFYDLMRCPMCLGFWIGTGVSLVVHSPTTEHLHTQWFLATIADGFISSGGVWIIYCMLNKTGCYEL